MTFPTPVIRVFFGLEYSSGLQFTLDDPVKGVLDNATYLLSSSDGDGVDIATDSFSIQIQRGRSRELDEFEAGSATVTLRNFNRLYDNLYSASTYFGDLVPGKRVQIEMYGQLIFAGTIEDWNLDWTVDGDAVATFIAFDALADLGRREFDEWTTTGTQAPGARLTAMLDRSEVGFGANRDFDTGQASLQSDLVTWGSNVLNYAQLVSKSDLGRLFAARDGTLTFRDRHNLASATAVVTFRDDGGAGGAVFHGVTTQTGSEALFNRAGVDREGGTLQTANDTTSQAAYGVRPIIGLSGLLMDTDIQSADMGQYLVSIYKDPATRISSITCRLHDPRLSALRGTIAALDMGDVIEGIWTPRDVGSAIDQVLCIEGVSHDISNDGGHYMTVNTAPAFQTAVFILDDSVWGVMDTGPGVLAF
jgi:hypothetical protein